MDDDKQRDLHQELDPQETLQRVQEYFTTTSPEEVVTKAESLRTLIEQEE